jgi:hypothetical protein
MLQIDQLLVTVGTLTLVGLVFFSGHSMWLFSVLLFAFAAHGLSLKLLISNPPDQDVLHESATQQTKRNKDGQRHGINYRQNLIPKRFRPMNQTLTKHLWRSPVWFVRNS